MTIIVGADYSDAGAVTDDGSPVSITGQAVDSSTIGDYVEWYNSTDTSGNIATPVSRTVHVVAVPVVLDSIAITTPATKLSYTIGDPLDTTGLVVTGTYSDGTTSAETITSADITGFDSSVAVASQILTITYNGKTVTYTVSITAVVAPSTGGGGGGTSSIPPVIPSVVTKLGDIDANGVVDEIDFALLMSQWSQTGTGLSADLNKDGVVDEIDFSLLMANWAV